MGLLAWLALGPPAVAEWGTLSEMHNYHECFGLDAEASPPFQVVLLESNAAGNIFHPGEAPRLTFQIQNTGEQTIQGSGKLKLIRYAQRHREGDPWYPELHALESYDLQPLRIELGSRQYRDITINPELPEKMGGYALVVDLGDLGSAYLTSLIRTYKPELERIPYPKQSLEEMPAPILARLGVQAIRWGIAYHPSDTRQARDQWERITRELREYHAHRITVVAEIGTGHQGQPLGRGRPHLDENHFMKDGKEDLVWLPEYDDDYQAFVYRLVSEFGWPKGPITGVMLWNEPWEGLSISGWGADMVRYRNLYRRMGDAVFRARKEDGVDVLVGGCDSSANTWDKLFPDGTDSFLPYLDFCSIHYQGLSSPVLYRKWNRRTDHHGRVLIWDTESWVANSDDRFVGVVASNRAAGYDRAMGTLSRIAVSVLSHNRIAHDRIWTKRGEKTIDRLIESRPLAAVYGASQHFIGEREFDRILFPNGLPWVFLFHGLQGNPDDGTAVVVGDLEQLFNQNSLLFHGVRRLTEVAAKLEILEQIDRGPADPEILSAWKRRLGETQPRSGAAFTLNINAEAPIVLLDAYGNPVPRPAPGQIQIPLDQRGFFLRADPAVPGSFQSLVRALEAATPTGLEPLDIVAYDMKAPPESGSTIRLRLTNMLPRSLRGALEVRCGELELTYPEDLEFQPRERRWITVTARGASRPDNTYPLRVIFDGGAYGRALHLEDMHVNWIRRRTIEIDGDLTDWEGCPPQIIQTDQPAVASFETSMWLPFVDLPAGPAGGLAVGYVAYDASRFYFGAKIADTTPHSGTWRYAARDADADFYPEVSYSRKDGRMVEHIWPEGVRRFSYRRWPEIPSSMPQSAIDNVLVAFNAIPMDEEEDWNTHLPGRMPKFIWFKSTDYEYALNEVAERHGGGTEIWRVLTPGMPFKHYYPRQPRHPKEGPVAEGSLVVRRERGIRIIEAALPWTEIPDVKARLDAGKTVKFSFRVNDNAGGPDMELARGRSAAEGISPAFHPAWSRSWPNELEFGFEK